VTYSKVSLSFFQKVLWLYVYIFGNFNLTSEWFDETLQFFFFWLSDSDLEETRYSFPKSLDKFAVVFPHLLQAILLFQNVRCLCNYSFELDLFLEVPVTDNARGCNPSALRCPVTVLLLLVSEYESFPRNIRRNMKPLIVVVIILCSHAVCLYFLLYKVTATLVFASK